MPDNYDMWVAHEASMEAMASRYPTCSHCGERILDDRIWDINGELYHPDCAEKEFCKWTDDYRE